MIVVLGIVLAVIVLATCYQIAQARGLEFKPVEGAKPLGLPRSAVGWWAFVCGLSFLPGPLLSALAGGNDSSQAVPPGLAWFVQFGAIPAFILGFIGGLLAIFALRRLKERSLMVWFALLPFTFIIFFFIGELVFPH